MAKKKETILKRLDSKEPVRGPVSIYIDTELFKRFKKACGKHGSGKVLEELIKDFLG